MLKFIPRDEWTTANEKITFDKVKVSTGVGKLDHRTGTFTCEQKGRLTPIFNNSSLFDSFQ